MTPARKGGKRVGYVRVSSLDQNTERQLEGVEVDKTFTDKASGKDTKRPQLQAALDYVRQGDVLVVHSMDRLARNMRDLQNVVKDLTDKGVTVEFDSEKLTFTGDDDKYATLMLHILGGVAQFERSIIKERQREGIAIAKAKGVYKGRKPSLSSAVVTEIRARLAAGEKKARLAVEFGVSRQTLYTAISKVCGSWNTGILGSGRGLEYDPITHRGGGPS
jgi:DNA invertase Pin-like site-specific DNA recombinase